MGYEVGQILYAPTKTGNVKTWRCTVTPHPNNPDTGLAVLTISTQTKLNGKAVVRNEVITEGKNIGRANETTPHEQALSEAKSRYNKKIDQGYGTEIPTDTSKAGTNALDLPKPMLAHPIDKVKKIEFPAWWQPKLDGHRAIVTRRDGELIMYSRQGKPITSMGHVLSYLDEIVGEGQFLDGELYLHGEALQNIGSLIKRKQAGSTDVLYYVYDIMLDVPFTQRAERLYDLFGDTTNVAQRLETYQVDGMDQAMQFTERVVQQGYEGGILRTPDKGYRAGFRSRTLLKIKKFDDAEFEILGVIQGKPRDVNGVYLQVAIFQLQTADGKPFEVLAPGTMHEKDRAWQNNHLYVGKQVTIKYMGLTKDGIPWHPVGLRIREDI